MYDATHASPHEPGQEEPAALERQTQEEEQQNEQVDPPPLAETVGGDATCLVTQRDLHETHTAHAPVESGMPIAPPLSVPDTNPYASEDSDDDSMDLTFSFGDLNGDTTLVADGPGHGAQAGKDSGAATEEHSGLNNDTCMQLDDPQEPRGDGAKIAHTKADAVAEPELDVLLDEAIASIVSL